MKDHPLTPARSRDLRQIVYDKIKDAIVNGIIPPGEKLSEFELSKQLEVSRTPIREAIRQLAQTGLVRLVPRKGAFVALPSPKEAKDLYEIRLALESLALEKICADPPREELLKFREIFSSVGSDWSSGQYLDQDRRFHGFISNQSGNAFLETVLHNVSDLIQLCRHYSMEGVPLERSSEEHVAIIDAILKGNLDLAKERLRQHLNNAVASLTGYITSHR
jgi:DNA-binding GntR family transcriptional regulator